MRILLLLIGLITGALVNASPSEALKSYRLGEKITDVKMQMDYFNIALREYENAVTDTPNGALLYNIGNCYFQLQEYPRAILYYYRALELLPRDSTIRDNLTIAQTQAGVELQEVSALTRILSLDKLQLSIGEKYQVFMVSWIGAVAALLFSLIVQSKSLKVVRGLFLGISLTVLASIAGTYYIAPVYAVLIQPTTLHIDAGEHYARVQSEPLIPGSKVELVEKHSSESWYKIRNQLGDIGYVAEESLRLVN